MPTRKPEHHLLHADGHICERKVRIVALRRAKHELHARICLAAGIRTPSLPRSMVADWRAERVKRIDRSKLRLTPLSKIVEEKLKEARKEARLCQRNLIILARLDAAA